MGRVWVRVVLRGEFQSWRLLLALALTIALFGCAHSQSAEFSPCESIIIHGVDELDFTTTEHNLICGDPEVRAYQHVPLYQAGFLLTGLLQSRGFSNIRQEIRAQKLHIYTSGKTKIEKIRVVSDSAEEVNEVALEMERLYKGEVLTPNALDAVEADALALLRAISFACAEVSSEAQAQSGALELTLKHMDSHVYGPIEREMPAGLHENAFMRFYPFDENDLFNERSLELSEKRLLRAGVVQGSYYLEDCSDGDLKLTHKFITGPARTIRFGVGVSTEVGPMARVRWSNERYGKMASLLEASVQASYRSQSLRLFSDIYWWPERARRSLATELKVTRENQSDYQELSAELRPHMKWSRDIGGRALTWSTGPTLITGRFETDENPDAQSFTTGALEAGLSVVSHAYEFFDLHPEEGSSFNFNIDLRHPSLGFIDPLLKLDVSHTVLKRVAKWGVGRLIAGARFKAGVTWVEDQLDIERLPPSVRYYAGGSDDVRGFELNSLPGDNGLGALTKVSSKLELRRTRFFTESLEGVLFIDGVMFGSQSWELQSKLWYSPGLGVRWLSPIGLVQTYYARGLETDSEGSGENLYFIGLGGVF